MKQNIKYFLINIILYIIVIAAVVFTGMLSWRWVHPDNFWSAVLFFLIWVVLMKLAHFISMAIIVTLFDK